VYVAHNLYIIQELYITATQVYDQKSTKIERNTVYKLSSIGKVPTAIEKSPGYVLPAIVFFAAEVPRFNLGAY
jgi:hypothetical protein